MVQLITNAKGFFNDMTEEVRLFLGQTDILPYAPEAELRLYVLLCGGGLDMGTLDVGDLLHQRLLLG